LGRGTTHCQYRDHRAQAVDGGIEADFERRSNLRSLRAAVGYVIEVERLKKAYGEVVAVDGVSFAVEQGEIFGILGPNGAGKTTAVECLQGLRRPDSGRLRVLGLDPQNGERELRGRIGSQLQESSLPDRIRVWEALDLFASLSPQAADWETLIGQWGLADKRNASFSSLSGGQRQRLFVALALVNEPEVVFLDEMTTGLDPAARRVAWDLVAAIRERGTTVVLVTHFMDEAERLCDRLAILNAGRVVAMGRPQQLIDEHAPQVLVRFSSDHAELGFLGELEHVDRVEREGHRVEVSGTGPALALVAAALVERGILPSDLRAERASLEDVFLSLTGGRFEEETAA
jgi:ABC-2 type transport system ATP-binding protein